MKKLTTIMTMLLLAALTATTTSCSDEISEDENLSMLMLGTWQGKMDISYTDGDGTNWKSNNTYVQFYNDLSYTEGHGNWCNTFDSNAPIPYMSYEFAWEVKDKYIHLYFPKDQAGNKAELIIGSYYIDIASFTGTISTTDMSKKANFAFTHTSSPIDWTIYPPYYPWYDPWDYPWYDPWYDPFFWTPNPSTEK